MDVESPISPPKKKIKTEGVRTDLLQTYQIEKWPEVPLKRISEVTLELLNELVRMINYRCCSYRLILHIQNRLSSYPFDFEKNREHWMRTNFFIPLSSKHILNYKSRTYNTLQLRWIFAQLKKKGCGIINQ